MTESTRTRSPRTGLPLDAVEVTGTVPLAEIATLTNRQRIGARRWEQTALDAIEASKRDEALVLKIAKGYRTDVVRAGLGEELKRHGYRFKSQTVANDDESQSMYIVAEPKLSEDT